MGETMAEARARITCQTDCAALLPSVNVIYDDVWTDPIAAGRPADASFAYRYSQPHDAGAELLERQLPVGLDHAVPHHDPLPDPHAPALDGAAADPRRGGHVIADHTCTSCHSPVDAAGAVRVPAAQLDLTGGPSPDEADHLVSYRELLFTDNAQEVNMGALQDILVPGPPDPMTGLPTPVRCR